MPINFRSFAESSKKLKSRFQDALFPTVHRNDNIPAKEKNPDDLELK